MDSALLPIIQNHSWLCPLGTHNFPLLYFLRVWLCLLFPQSPQGFFVFSTFWQEWILYLALRPLLKMMDRGSAFQDMSVQLPVSRRCLWNKKAQDSVSICAALSEPLSTAGRKHPGTLPFLLATHVWKRGMCGRGGCMEEGNPIRLHASPRRPSCSVTCADVTWPIRSMCFIQRYRKLVKSSLKQPKSSF